MAVFRTPDAIDRITHPALRAAARRCEAATGQRVAGRFGDPPDEGLLGVYLIMRGWFDPMAAQSNASDVRILPPVCIRSHRRA